jgi:sugar phosphate isomerase/epimerase
MLNRREFVAAGLGALALTTRPLAHPGDRFRWAISSHMFTPLKPHPETGIQMAARFGFHGIEPWGNELQEYLHRPPAAFKQVLDSSGIGISSVASGGDYLDEQKLPGILETHGTNAKFASYFGVKALKANVGRRAGPADLEPATARLLAAHLNQVGERTLKYGVRFAVHPHAWTMIERQREIEMILDMTDPALVFLTLDTCHASVGGVDPVAFTEKHYSRIAHFHFKDTLPVWSAGKAWKGPAPTNEEEIATAKRLGVPIGPHPIYQRLGTGGVDFPALIAVLRDKQYDGWISLDFNAVDMPPGVTIEQDMTAHRKYLVERLNATMQR